MTVKIWFWINENKIKYHFLKLMEWNFENLVWCYSVITNIMLFSKAKTIFSLVCVEQSLISNVLLCIRSLSICLFLQLLGKLFVRLMMSIVTFFYLSPLFYKLEVWDVHFHFDNCNAYFCIELIDSLYAYQSDQLH